MAGYLSDKHVARWRYSGGIVQRVNAARDLPCFENKLHVKKEEDNGDKKSAS